MKYDLERYWLAGLLEGEGSFIKGPPSTPRVARVTLPMTDRDVVERAAGLFGRAVSHFDRKAEQPRKRVFITSLKGTLALRLMTDIYPVMGAPGGVPRSTGCSPRRVRATRGRVDRVPR